MTKTITLLDTVGGGFNSIRQLSRNKKPRRESSAAIEPLELRLLMTVLDTTITGTPTTGEVTNYQTSSNGTVVSTMASTFKGTGTAPGGQSANDTQSILSISGNTFTNDSYTALTPEGFINYGTTSKETNSSGGVLSQTTSIYSSGMQEFPVSITPGQAYNTSTIASISQSLEGGSPTITTETLSQSFTLISATPTTIVSPPGSQTSYQCYQCSTTTTTAPADSSISPTTATVNEWFAPGIGLVRETGGTATEPIEIDLTSVSGNGGGGGGGGSGGGGTTTTGAVTPAFVKTSLPTSVVSGSTVHDSATVSVTNSLASKVKVTFATKLYASADGTIDGTSILLGTAAPRTLLLAANATTNVVIPITSLSAELLGSYTLLAETIDSTGTSIASTGPTLTAATPFIAFSNESITTTLTGSIVSGSKTSASVEITLTNTGNIASTKTSSVELLVSPDGTVASGTEIHTKAVPIDLKPDQTKTYRLPLTELPNVSNGTYQVVAQITDQDGDVTSTATTTTANLAASFVQLDPTFTSETAGAHGTELVTVSITNNGNSAPVGRSTLVLSASTDTIIADGTTLTSIPSLPPLRPGQTKPFTLHLTATEVTEAQSLGTFIAVVKDPLGDEESATTSVPLG